MINIESADSQFASAYLSFTSNILQANEITDYLTRIVQPRLTALGGVQRADILGGRTFAMRIWLKPERMAALNVSPAQVRKALAAQQFSLRRREHQRLARSGQSDRQHRSAHGRGFQATSSFARTNGTLVRLGDIADVVLGAEDYNTEVRFSGQRAVFMGDLRFAKREFDRRDQAGAGRDGADPEGAAHRHGGPHRLRRARPTSTTAIKDVFKTLIETLLIVMIVIFLFLGSWRSVIIPIVAIPISLIGAVFLMQIFGFTLNLLTLLAIVLSVGLVVDDAIVVVENVERHMREGLTPLNAALLGARELVGPIIAMTITLAAVYTPIGIQGGLTGTLFREFALHPGRRGLHFRRRRAHAFAGHVGQLLAGRTTRSMALPAR